jgi:tRNA(Ile)-lysidine synthase
MKATLLARQAVRPWVEEVTGTILVGVSGGADSMALVIATKLEAKSAMVIPVIIDHGLQENSAHIADEVFEKLSKLNFTNIEKIRVTVEITDGLEASARRARYAAFESVAKKYNSQCFFLGHTENDLAESVLLGLARGSGTRSLSGIAEVNGIFIRPFLHVSRETTEEVCKENFIEPWQDPHNSDRQFARVRVRKDILPLLERDLGPGITDSLARSSRILRDDADALDQLAKNFMETHDPCDVEELRQLPKALRVRVLRALIYEAGAPAGMLTYDHILPIEALITAWHGQGATSLPGGVKVERISGRLSLLQQGSNQ